MLNVVVEKARGAFRLNAHFEAPTPGVVALFGRSGCGKTTLVNVIAGLLQADTGRIAVDDFELLDTGRRLNVAVEQRAIGYVFQDARLFPHLNVMANLQYSLKRAARPTFITLERVIDFLALSPLLRRRTHELSGGERQRIAIGRALLSQPRLLLLDEPLASLDSARREEVLPYLELLRDELSVPMVYVSHDFDEVLRLATHLVLMDEGQVIAQGGVGEMSLNPALRAIIGMDAVGAVVEGIVLGEDIASGLTRVRVGDGELNVKLEHRPVATRVRVQLLARDIIVATQPAQSLSVRNSLKGVIAAIASDHDDSDLITIDVGGAAVMARVTHAATRELNLAIGLPVWALVKAVSLRGHTFSSA